MARFSFDDREYSRPKAMEIRSNDFGEAFIMDAGRFEVKYFIGKQKKVAKFIRYGNSKIMDERIQEFLDYQEQRHQWKLDEKAKQKAEREEAIKKIEVGSIFVSSWGYEQTNVDAYQVVEKRGKMTLVLREISTVILDDTMQSHGMSCDVKPSKDSFLEKSEPLVRRINAYGGVKISECQSASLWDGVSKFYCSWYA